MSDPFARLIPEATQFLADLAANNSRDWFLENKARYDDTLKTPAKMLLDQVAQEIGRKTGTIPTTKLFRANRDVRFSKDKSPYHLHLQMLWTLPGLTDVPGARPVALFFGIEPDSVTAGGGIMGFDKADLITWRTALDGAWGEDFATTLQQATTLGFKLGDPDLRRIPAPFDADHPRGHLLRRKGLTMWRQIPTENSNAPTSALLSTFDDLRPVLTSLSQMT